MAGSDLDTRSRLLGSGLYACGGMYKVYKTEGWERETRKGILPLRKADLRNCGGTWVVEKDVDAVEGNDILGAFTALDWV